MNRRRKIYEGKAKDLYEGPEPGTLVQYFKDDATAGDGAKHEILDDIMSLAVRVNDFLTGLFMGVGIQLVDFKIECGRLYENDTMRIVLADEISPDSCRLWDVKTRNKMDKDRFRQDLGGLVDAYREVAQRLGILVENDNALTTGPRLVQ